MKLINVKEYKRNIKCMCANFCSYIVGNQLLVSAFSKKLYTLHIQIFSCLEAAIVEFVFLPAGKPRD